MSGSDRLALRTQATPGRGHLPAKDFPDVLCYPAVVYQDRAQLATAVVAIMLPAVTWSVAGCSATAPGKSAPRTAAPGPAKVEVAAKTAAPPPARRAKPAVEEQAVGHPKSDTVEQLAAQIERRVREALAESVAADRAWKPIDVIGWSGRPGAGALQLTFSGQQEREPVAVYYLVPWQPLFAPAANGPGEMLPGPPLLTVTERALVFAYPPSGAGDSGPGPALHAAVSEALQLDRNQRDIADAKHWPLPEKLRAISLHVYPHYAVVLAALPGSGLPHPGGLSRAFPHRMVRLSLIPDRGRVIRQWIAPEPGAKGRPEGCPCRGNETR